AFPVGRRLGLAPHPSSDPEVRHGLVLRGPTFFPRARAHPAGLVPVLGPCLVPCRVPWQVVQPWVLPWVPWAFLVGVPGTCLELSGNLASASNHRRRPFGRQRSASPRYRSVREPSPRLSAESSQSTCVRVAAATDWDQTCSILGPQSFPYRWPLWLGG